MTDWQRLEQVIKWTGLSTNAFALGIGLKRSENLYQIKRGNHGISKELAELIGAKYPSIRAAWLLTGEGSMQGATSESGSAPPDGIPYYDVEAGRLNRLPEQPACTLSLPPFGPCDLAINASGRAMEPEIPNGSIVLLRETGLETLLPGEVYAVVTADLAALRYVRLTPNGDLLLQAANRADFDDLVIARQQLRRLYQVRGVLTKRG